jgi:two-component system, cell cycle sensor histidine kinase and response regulator CckA
MSNPASRVTAKPGVGAGGLTPAEAASPVGQAWAEALAALRASEERFRNAVHYSAIGMALVAPDGRWLEVNPALCRIVGYTREELLAGTFQDITHPEDLEADMKFVRQMLAGELETYQMEKRYFHKDGRVVWVLLSVSLVRDAAGQPLHFIAQIQDLTERKQVDAALRESEERHRMLFRRNPLPMWVVEAETLAALAVNDAAVEHYGYTREEFLAMSLRDLWPAEDASKLAGVCAAPGSGRNRVGAHRHRKKDGTLIRVEVISDDAWSGGRPARLVLALDVTDKERAQENLRGAEAQLRQSQKMEAVGRLAGGIAHDFNNVLTVVKSFTEFLLEDLDETDPRRADVQEIAKAADRAAGMTRRLLAFSRRQVLQPRQLDLNGVIGGMERMLQRLIGDDVRITTSLDSGLLPVQADPGSIEQVILNLAVNARDAMPNGGTLSIETHNARLDRPDANWAIQPGPYAMLSIRDTGHGMDAATQARIFEPFFTTKGQGEGTGLGLAMVYGIIKQSRGHVWVTSKPDQGTTFTLYLPQVVAVKEEPAAKPAAVAATSGGGETILLVDDEEALRSAARRALVRAGYRVIPAVDGPDALRVYMEHTGTPFALVVTDVVMPGLGGRELVGRLKVMSPNLRVLFVSGYTEEGVRKQGVLQPGTEFLEKPFTPEKLLRKIRDILDAPPPAVVEGRN